jgi:hypothetical protein
VVVTIVPRRELAGVVAIIKRFDPGAFYTIDALQSRAAGVIPAPRRRLPGPLELLVNGASWKPVAERSTTTR